MKEKKLFPRTSVFYRNVSKSAVVIRSSRYISGIVTHFSVIALQPKFVQK